MAWLCKSCKGPDKAPWRNWADKARCHKCGLLKAACRLRDVPKSGSPTNSVRQGRGGGSGGSGGKGSGLSAGQPAASDAGLKKELETTKRRLEDIEAKFLELGGVVAVPASATADDDSKVRTLRSEIAGLEKISGPLAEAALAAKKAELAAILLARREAKPLDSRVKDLERVVEAKRRAADKTAQHLEDLGDNLAQLLKDIEAAKQKDLQANQELATVEAEKAVILRRVADEAAAGTNLATPLQPKVVLQGLSSLFEQIQPAHCQHLGMSPEQAKAFMDMLAAMLQVPGPSSGAAAASGGMAAPGAQQHQPAQPVAVASQQLLPTPSLLAGGPQVAAVPSTAGGGGGGGAEEGEDPEDEEMGGDALADAFAAVGSATGPEAVAALMASLREQGVWVRKSRRRTVGGKPTPTIIKK